MAATHPFWTSVDLVLAPGAPTSVEAFWGAVTGHDRLRVRRPGAGPTRLRLDLHVRDPRAASDDAVASGARVTDRPDDGHVALRSPGGLPFCFVSRPASEPAPPATWPGGHASVVDQVCLDIPSASYDAEVGFWERLTGWERRVSADRDEFQRLVRPADQPLHLLLQRLGEADGEVRAHLDLATTDRAAETERHLALGARLHRVTAGWTVLADPAGSAYCITDRTPGTRVLDEAPEH